MSASRGAVPSTSAISAMRSGFCRSSDNSRAGAVQIGEEVVEAQQRGVRIVACAPICSSSTGTSSARWLRANSPLQRAMLAGEPAAHRWPRLPAARRKPSAASRSSVSRSSVSGGKFSAGRSGRRRRLEQAGIVAAAPCRDGRPAPPRMHRGRHSRESARSVRAPSRSAGSVWVCSSLTICSRCSTVRRKQ